MAIILLFLSLFIISSSGAQIDQIGVTYVSDGENLPNVADVRNFLNKTFIRNVRLYNMDPGVLLTMAAMDFRLVVGSDDNTLLTGFSQNPGLENDWVSNLLPVAKNIDTFVFGNWAMGNTDQNHTVNSMKRLQYAFDRENLNIKVTTIVDSQTVIRDQNTPSEECVREEYYEQTKKLLHFLRANKSPFMTTVFPYYKYASDPTEEILDFYLFAPNKTRTDMASGLTYSNMFELQVDAIRNALDGFQFPDIEIVVAETGWPTWSNENEASANSDNASKYNKHLIEFLMSGKGTPMMPNRDIKTYIHTLFDENKHGNRGFGMLNNDLTWRYNVI